MSRGLLMTFSPPFRAFIHRAFRKRCLVWMDSRTFFFRSLSLCNRNEINIYDWSSLLFMMVVEKWRAKREPKWTSAATTTTRNDDSDVLWFHETHPTATERRDPERVQRKSLSAVIKVQQLPFAFDAKTTVRQQPQPQWRAFAIVIRSDLRSIIRVLIRRSRRKHKKDMCRQMRGGSRKILALRAP